MADEKHDEDYCPKSEENQHEPDWNTITITHDVITYVDVSCKHCGVSGCVGSEKTLIKNICW